MVDTQKHASFLVLFAFCTLWTSEVVFGHFSIGREVKLPFREGQINSQRTLKVSPISEKLKGGQVINAQLKRFSQFYVLHVI